MFKKLIYIEINNQNLFITTLKSKQGKFLLTSPTTIKLKNSEIINNTLFNLSSIYLHVNKYLKTHFLEKSTAYISITHSNNTNTISLKILQVALCISKTGIKIKKIINESFISKDKEMSFPKFIYKKDIKTKLNFFDTFKQNPNTHPFKWIFYTTLAFLLLLTTIFTIQSNQQLELQTIKIQNKELIKLNKILEKNVKSIHKVKNTNIKIKQKIKALNKLDKNNINSKKILSLISTNIPSNCFLKQVKISRLKKNKHKFTNINIHGETLAQNNALIFNQRLQDTNIFSKIQISKLEKTEPDNNYKPYNFMIIGTLK